MKFIIDLIWRGVIIWIYFKWNWRVSKWLILIVVMIINEGVDKKIDKICSSLEFRGVSKYIINKGWIIKFMVRFDMVRFDNKIFDVECKEDVF